MAKYYDIYCNNENNENNEHVNHKKNTNSYDSINDNIPASPNYEDFINLEDSEYGEYIDSDFNSKDRKSSYKTMDNRATMTTRNSNYNKDYYSYNFASKEYLENKQNNRIQLDKKLQAQYEINIQDDSYKHNNNIRYDNSTNDIIIRYSNNNSYNNDSIYSYNSYGASNISYSNNNIINNDVNYGNDSNNNDSNNINNFNNNDVNNSNNDDVNYDNNINNNDSNYGNENSYGNISYNDSNSDPGYNNNNTSYSNNNNSNLSYNNASTSYSNSSNNNFDQKDFDSLNSGFKMNPKKRYETASKNIYSKNNENIYKFSSKIPNENLTIPDTELHFEDFIKNNEQCNHISVNEVRKCLKSNSIDINIDSNDLDIRSDLVLENKTFIRLWGQIKDSGLNPIENAIVSLLKPGFFNGSPEYLCTSTTMTDEKGFYQFDLENDSNDSRDNVYRIVVTKPTKE